MHIQDRAVCSTVVEHCDSFSFQEELRAASVFSCGVWFSFLLKVHHRDLAVSEVDYMYSMTTKSYIIFMTFDSFCSAFPEH